MSGLFKPTIRRPRSEAELTQHYRIERELADKLRRAPREERRRLYSEVYDELFRRVPHHSQLARKHDTGATQHAVRWQWGLLRRFAKPDTVFLEVGAGDCALSLWLCSRVHKVFAADVSRIVAAHANPPSNFTFLLLEGTEIALPSGSVDLAYSNQVLEHLHPEDAADHVGEVFRVLKPGGAYVCVTPNRAAGPWDVSQYFDETATGFHLKEYGLNELRELFEKAGFGRLICYVGAGGLYVRSPAWPVLLLEEMLWRLPFGWRFRLGRTLVMRSWLGLKVAACK